MLGSRPDHRAGEAIIESHPSRQSPGTIVEREDELRPAAGVAQEVS
jgi:hypothetical protein